MLVSVVMPTFNGGRFLDAQIESILAQTTDDFELLVIDDGSSDDTITIVDDHARRDHRIRRLASTGNQGQRHRLIELVAAATGEFIAIADQDDIWHPERNARLLAAIGDRAVALGRSQLVDRAGVDLGRTVLDAFDVEPGTTGPLAALFLPLVSAHAALFRRSWMNPGAFYGVLPFDRALGLEALFSTGLIYVDDAVVFHRIHGGNQVNGEVARKRGEGKLISRHRLRESLGFVQPTRLWFAQTLDQLGRSGALAPAIRGAFAQLAGMCWHGWFGTGRDRTAMEAEFHRRLDHLAGDEADLRFFGERLRSVVRGQWTPVNLQLAWQHYNRRG